MSTQTDTSIRTSITVEAPIERAFAVFVEDFDRVKPREHNMLGAEIAETVFEPRAGGHVYDRGVDGSECRWARVLAYEPPHRLVFTWDISPHWRLESDPERAYWASRHQVPRCALLSGDRKSTRLNSSH